MKIYNRYEILKGETDSEHGRVIATTCVTCGSSLKPGKPHATGFHCEDCGAALPDKNPNKVADFTAIAEDIFDNLLRGIWRQCLTMRVFHDDDIL